MSSPSKNREDFRRRQYPALPRSPHLCLRQLPNRRRPSSPRRLPRRFRRWRPLLHRAQHQRIHRYPLLPHRHWSPTPTRVTGYKLAVNGVEVAPTQSIIYFESGTLVLSRWPGLDGKFPINVPITLTVYPNSAITSIIWGGVDGHRSTVATLMMNQARFVTLQVGAAQMAPTPVPVPVLVPTPTPVNVGPPTPLPTATPTPQPPGEPTHTPTPTPTVTPTPVPTPTPTPTPTVTPTQTPAPSGGPIAFSSFRDGNWEIYLMDTDGSNQIKLATNASNDSDPTWSPDGSNIAFTSDRDGNNEIYVMSSDGSNQTRVTSDTGNDDGPNWSPDGSQISFRSNVDGTQEIYVMSPDGSNKTRLTNNSFNDSDASWCPNGRITFGSIRGGDWDIYIMDRDGSNESQLTQVDPIIRTAVRLK